MRAPFAYYGGKTGMAPRIVDLLPAHKVYIEPFFGSGAVLFAKPPSTVEIVNDAYDGVVAFFRALRDNPDELERLCALSPHARAEFNAAAEPCDDPMEQARRFWVRVNQSFAKTANTTTGWSCTTARNQSIPGSIRNRLGRFSAIADRLASVTIEHCDAADLIDRMATPTTVVYADPPYPWEARSGRANRSNGYADYAHDMGSEVDHRRLAEVLRSTPAAVVLSGYHCELYDELYADWDRVEIGVTLKSSNSKTVDRGSRTEVLWSNRPISTPRLFTEPAS